MEEEEVLHKAGAPISDRTAPACLQSGALWPLPLTSYDHPVNICKRTPPSPSLELIVSFRPSMVGDFSSQVEWCEHDGSSYEG